MKILWLIVAIICIATLSMSILMDGCWFLIPAGIGVTFFVLLLLMINHDAKIPFKVKSDSTPNKK